MLYNFYCLGKQQGHQKTITMVTKNSTILQEQEQDEDCNHMVCSRLILSGMRHLDERVQPECNNDYVSDPNTGEVEKTCPKCNFYLREYLLHLMQKTDFVLSVERFFCSGCLTTKKIPPPGYGKVTAVCGGCLQLLPLLLLSHV